MKFTQNTPVVQPNTIGNVAVRVSGDPMAYGTGGKEYGALAGAIGQMAKVAKEQQDDADAADVMEARNKIMGSLTESMYGEKGLLTNGIGENAKGLEGRVTDTVQKTFDSISKNYNIRVQRALRGNLSENMGNFQRIAAQQEGREYRKQKDSHYGLSIDNSANMAMLNYQDPNLLDSTINDALRIADWRAKDMGYSEQQRLQERRNVLTAVAGAAINKAIEDSDLETASIYNDRYGQYMNQKDVMKFQKVLRQEKRLVDEKNEIDELVKTTLTASGEPDWNKIEQIIKDRAKQTKVIGGGGSFFADSSLNDEIMAAAQEFNVDPALVAAVADAESNGNQNAVSSVGALGVMQLMPDTAASLGVDPHDRKQNIRGGAKYLRQMLDTFGGDVQKAVAAYNAGPGAVKDYGGVPPYKETQNYVAKILGEGGTYSKYKKSAAGGVSFEKLDSDIDAAGVKIDGAKPQTIGMINYAKKVYKEMFGLDDFWVSSVTGGHDAGTPHALGYKADVGGSALKDINNLKKYQQALQAAGIGCNDEYNYKSKGWTGPHLDLDARGTNWQTGEEFGGFKGGGGSSRTVNAHDSGYEDRMIRRLEAARADWKRRKADEGNTRLEGYQSQIQNAGSAENALSILERIKGSEKDPAIYSKAIQTARTYYPDAFKVSNSITGTRRTGSSRTNNKIVGSDGETYTKAQIRRAQSAMKRFYNDEHITEAEQERYDNAANILKAVGLGGDGDNLDNPEAFTVAREVWNQTQDYGKAHKWLQDVYGFTYNEATYYLDNME